jgi:hypothetical protein
MPARQNQLEVPRLRFSFPSRVAGKYGLVAEEQKPICQPAITSCITERRFPTEFHIVRSVDVRSCQPLGD